MAFDHGAGMGINTDIAIPVLINDIKAISNIIDIGMHDAEQGNILPVKRLDGLLQGLALTETDAPANVTFTG